MILTHHNLLAAAQTILPPPMKDKFKRGIYNAIATLKKRGKLKLAPGGFEIVR